MRDILSEIWSTAKRNKLRTALTGFAVAWGIFMLIFLLGAGNGLIHATEQNSNQFLANSMEVFGNTTSKPYKGFKEGRSVQLTDQDFALTKDHFPAHIDEIGAVFSEGPLTISYGDNYTSSPVLGVFPNYQAINKLEIRYGRFINNMDNERQRKVIVLADEQAKELTSRPIQSLIGQYVDVGNYAFQVVGIYKKNQSGSISYGNTPFTTLRTMYGGGNKMEQINFSFHGLETEEANEAFEKSLRASINKRHEAAPDDDNAVWIDNRFTQNMQMDQGSNIIRTALWIVGLFTLLSGIVGVSNIMLITVKERTREFGIRKAIGATPWAVLKLIIIESIIITTFFGYIGMLLGIVANEYMNIMYANKEVDAGLFHASMFVNPTVGLDVCVKALLVMVVAGTLAGLMPARKAAKIRPIEALRAE